MGERFAQQSQELVLRNWTRGLLATEDLREQGKPGYQRWCSSFRAQGRNKREHTVTWTAASVRSVEARTADSPLRPLHLFGKSRDSSGESTKV